MAKKTHDREDLLRDATGYVQRIEFNLPEIREPIFCGIRKCGAWSIYIGQDNVLQFNSDDQLRRAFWRDRMLASYRGVLHWLDRSDRRVRLGRIPLTDSELAEFKSAAQGWLSNLHERLATQQYSVRGQFPVGSNIEQQVREWLERHHAYLEFAAHPGVGRS